MIDLDLIKNFSIDKSDWVTVKFGDIVYEPKESVKDPIAEGIEHVVGLEHIDSEDIHLRHSASIEESTTFTKRFRKGDILFGRRRAYLKKAAKAEFDGICSGDITVMRANEELLLPELLPFIVNNDKFFDFAVEHSAGGLSPRVKFKDLAEYKLLLPLKEQQAEIAKLLWALDDVTYKYSKNINNQKILRETVLYEEFFLKRNWDKVQKEGWEKIQLGGLIDALETGPCVKYIKDRVNENVPSLLKTSSISTNSFLPEESLQVIDSDIPKLKVSPKKNSIIISRINTAQLVGASAFINDDYPNLYLPDRLWQTVISKTDIVNSRWLSFILSSPTVRSMILRLCAGTSDSMKYLTKEVFLSIVIPLPPITKQRDLANKILQIDNTIRNTECVMTESKQFQKSLISQVFQP